MEGMNIYGWRKLIFQREQQKKNESLSIKSIKPENFG
jgi:hypothetical protein